MKKEQCKCGLIREKLGYHKCVKEEQISDSWENDLIEVLRNSVLTPDQVGKILPWLVSFIKQTLAKQKEQDIKVKDVCLYECAYETGKIDMKKEMLEKIAKIKRWVATLRIMGNIKDEYVIRDEDLQELLTDGK